MNLLNDVITYVRRIIKSPSNAVITDELIIDYINRFWIMDVDARIQLFDLKTKYQFQTQPGVDQYNMPLYDLQTSPTGSNQTIGMYPVYQGFVGPAYINGIQIPLQTQKELFFNIWPNIVQQQIVIARGDGTAGPYNFTVPISPFNTLPLNPPIQAILRGHVDITGIIATGSNIDPPLATNPNPTLNLNIPSTSIYPAVYITSTASDGSNIIVQDSGQFLQGNTNFGLLMRPGTAPFGYSVLTGGYSTTSNTINYLTGEVNVTFPTAIPAGADINLQCYFFQCGLPRSILYYNNTLTLRSPPDQQYLVELDAYLSPSAFLSTSQGIQFAYMAEYLSLGAARKILSDTGDAEQLQFYEPRFREQEALVHIRSQRQWTATRTQTIYSQGINQGQSGFNNLGGSTL
jgi:hypothetical protein